MADSAAKKAWTAANTTRIVMNLNHNTDADILTKLNQVASKQGYIKELIRKDIAKPKMAGMTKKQSQAMEAFKLLSEDK